MEFKKPKSKNSDSEWVNCSRSLLSESQVLSAGENNDWVDCSRRTKITLLETNQQCGVSQVGSVLPLSNYHSSLDIAKNVSSAQGRVDNQDTELENAECSLDLLNFIPESLDYDEYVKKRTRDMIATAVEELKVKELLQPYVEKHKITERTLPLLRPGKNKLTQSVSAPCSPSTLHKVSSISTKCNSNWVCEEKENDKDILKKSSDFTSLAIIVTALGKEKGPRTEAPFFIRSLCRDIMRATLLIIDDITEEILTIIGNAASLIADMVQKDLEPASYRGYSLGDIGITDFVENVLDCIPDTTRISKFSGGRNKFVHHVIKNLIPSQEIRKIILDNLCIAIKSCYSKFFVKFTSANGSAAIIPPAEINGLFHYFQLLNLVILCSSEEPWIEESDVENIKELERIAKTRLPLHLVAIYATRTAVHALKYEKKST